MIYCDKFITCQYFDDFKDFFMDNNNKSEKDLLEIETLKKEVLEMKRFNSHLKKKIEN